MSSLSSISSAVPASTPASATGGAAASPSSSSTAIPSSLAAADALDAGVVATFSSPDASPDSTSTLYTNLANLAASAGTPSTSSPIDLNAQWASAIKNNPSLAPLAEQMAANQALLKAVL